MTNMLNDNELSQVVGGAGNVQNADKIKEFSEAWDALDMEGKGYSGIARGELYDKWERSKGKSAAAFLMDFGSKV